MSLHQVILRKDGPTHAIEFREGRYAFRTLCGLSLSGLERPKFRLFDWTSDACGRCVTSYTRKRSA